MSGQIGVNVFTNVFHTEFASRTFADIVKPVTEIDDSTIHRALGGHIASYEMIFKAWYPALCSFARQLIADADEAEEIVQNVFVTLWEKRGEIKIDQSLRAYLFRSVRNRSLNRIKHEQVKREHAADHLNSMHSADMSIDGDLGQVELQKRIDEALTRIPPQCRQVFVLSRFEELKYAEIAEQLGISIKTVENQMGKALRIMRQELADYLVILIGLGAQWLLISM